MEAYAEVREFLARWARAMEARDVERSADLFLRQPAPLVTFSDGERVRDWLDVRVRLDRDFARVVVERVEVSDLLVQELADGAVVASFHYDIHVRDMWNTSNVVPRLASMALVRTKDGLRVAQAHFSAAPA